MLVPLTVLALVLSLPPPDGEEDKPSSIFFCRAALRVAEWRDLNYLAGFPSPHEWVSDPANCTHSSSFGPGVAYIPGCVHGRRYSAVEVLSSAEVLCAELKAHGVRNVTMMGDSFMRHLYMAHPPLFLSSSLPPFQTKSTRHPKPYTRHPKPEILRPKLEIICPIL